MYKIILELDNLSRQYNELNKILKTLEKYDAVTASGARKRLVIPKYKKIKAEIFEEYMQKYEELKGMAKSYIKKYPKRKMEIDIVIYHYRTIDNTPDDMNQNIIQLSNDETRVGFIEIRPTLVRERIASMTYKNAVESME